MDKQNREFVWRQALNEARMHNRWTTLLYLFETEDIPVSLRDAVAVEMLLRKVPGGRNLKEES